MNKICLFILFTSLFFKVSYAQKTEFGFFVGSSGYFGDVGYEKAEKTLLHQSPAIGVMYKINTHDYLSLRTSIQAGKIKAHDQWATTQIISLEI